MNIYKKQVFSAISGAQDAVLLITNDETLKLEFTGTATFTAKVYASVDGENYTQITGIKDQGLVLATDITAVGIYSFDVTGYTSLKVSATAVSGGTLSATVSMNKV